MRNHIKNKTDGLIIDIALDITLYPNLKYFQEMKDRGIPLSLIHI